MSPALLLLALTAPVQAQSLFSIDPAARGAWFRKVESAAGVSARGIEAWGVLPKPSFDPAREHEAASGEEAYKSGPLDRPDVYVGLGADGAEVDAGLIWDHVYGADGRDTGKWAYRVYWRTSRGGWRNPEPGASDDIYLEPGERFALTLTVAPDGTSRLAVRRAGRRAAARAYEFPVPGLSGKPFAVKRVHSIDQFRLEGGKRKGNEGRAAIPTAASLSGGRWEGAHLLLEDGERRALAGSAATVVRGPDAASIYSSVFPSAGVGEGGSEEMSVYPPRP